MTTCEDLRYGIQQSYNKYSDDELWKMIITGHYSCGTRREVNEGFYAAEMLIDRLRKQLKEQK